MQNKKIYFFKILKCTSTLRLLSASIFSKPFKFKKKNSHLGLASKIVSGDPLSDDDGFVCEALLPRI